jgi:hypothetical protein
MEKYQPMKRSFLAALAALLCLCSLTTERAAAQFSNIPSWQNRGIVNPPYSPYLNLLRRDAPLFQNYYGLVRPELQFRSAVRGLQAQIGSNRQAITNLEQGTEVPPTGHRTTFLSYGNYFLSSAGAAVTSPAPAAPRAAAGGRGTVGITRPAPPRRR